MPRGSGMPPTRRRRPNRTPAPAISIAEQLVQQMQQLALAEHAAKQ